MRNNLTICQNELLSIDVQKDLGGFPYFYFPFVIVPYSSGHFFYRCGALSVLKLIAAITIVFQIEQVALTSDFNRL